MDVPHIIGHCVAGTFFLLFSFLSLHHLLHPSSPGSRFLASPSNLKNAGRFFPFLILLAILESVGGAFNQSSLRGLFWQSAHIALYVLFAASSITALAENLGAAHPGATLLSLSSAHASSLVLWAFHAALEKNGDERDVAYHLLLAGVNGAAAVWAAVAGGAQAGGAGEGGRRLAGEV